MVANFEKTRENLENLEKQTILQMIGMGGKPGKNLRKPLKSKKKKKEKTKKIRKSWVSLGNQTNRKQGHALIVVPLFEFSTLCIHKIDNS